MNKIRISVLSIAAVTSLLFTFSVRADNLKGDQTEVTTSRAEAPADEEDTSRAGLFSASYFSIFYGPSLKDTSSYQPTSQGTPDFEKPVLLKNYLGLTYNVTDHIAVTPTAYWSMTPIRGNRFVIQDPFLRVSHNNVWGTDSANLYSDVRIHFGVSNISRSNDMLGGVQTFQALTYGVPSTRLTAGLYGSARGNIYGRQGFGNDIELYLSPNLAYQLTPSLAVSMLYEMQANHVHGDSFGLNNEGTDLEPGVSWDITPRINVNPYLNIQTGGKVNLQSTSVGMLASVRFI